MGSNCSKSLWGLRTSFSHAVCRYPIWGRSRTGKDVGGQSMKYFLALLGVAALCGCGNSSRTVEHTETTTTQIGVSKPYSKEKWTTRCVSGGCSRWSKEDIEKQKAGDIKAAEARGEFVSPTSNESASVVELPPEPSGGATSVSAEAPVPVSNAPVTTTTTTKVTTPSGTTTTTTTTTRTIRWPRKLD